jgi:hypothetical protein
MNHDRETVVLRKSRQFDFGEPSKNVADYRSAPLSLPRPDLFLRRKAPTPSPVFATYWRFAKIRQDTYFKRLFDPGNLTLSEDPILQRHRFTNVYRASDRVSQYLIRRVLFDRVWSPTDLAFRLLIFKFFNKIETWEAIERTIGDINWESYDFRQYASCLSGIMDSGKTIYSAAYIMASGSSIFGYERKHQNHLKVIEMIMADQFPDRVAQLKSLESVYRLLRKYPCIGPFVGYQFAIDINYSCLVNFSENEFVEPGPGALDGIAKCFSDPGDYSPTDIIRYMTDVQEEAFNEFAPDFSNLWGRPLHLIDCQNIFCEVDKYARIAHPEIEGRSKRSRIKQIYRPLPQPMEKPWYPPEWHLNDRIASDSRLNVTKTKA